MIKSSKNEISVKLPSDLPFLDLLPGATATLELMLCPESRLGSYSLVKVIPHNSELKCFGTPLVNQKRTFRIEVTNQSGCKLVFRDGESFGQAEEIILPFVYFDLTKKDAFGPYQSLCVRYSDDSKNTYLPHVKSKSLFKNQMLKSTKPEVIFQSILKALKN